MNPNQLYSQLLQSALSNPTSQALGQLGAGSMGMGSTPQLPQGPAMMGVMGQGGQSMNPAHHNFYEQLRQFLMQNMHVPGVDKILNTVNQQHVSQLMPKVPTMPIATQ